QRIDTRHAAEVGDIDGARRGIVPFEVRRIDVYTGHMAGRAEAKDAPIVGVVGHATPPTRFPPVHPLAPFGVLALDPDWRIAFDQVFLSREELVARSHDRHAAP